MSFILRLPQDLLEDVLVLVVRSSLYPGRAALDISHVCSVWRAVALGCSRLWGIIDTRNMKISSLFVSRTRKRTPLDVLVASSRSGRPPDLFSTAQPRRSRWKERSSLSFESILPCLHNIRYLTLYLSYAELRSFSAFTSGMPLQLASLTIVVPPTWEVDDHSFEQRRVATLVPPVFINTQGCVDTCKSYLKSLTLADISLPWAEIPASLQSLTYLAITSPASRPSLKEIHNVLRHTTLLRRLVLDDVFEDAILDFDSSPPDCSWRSLSPIQLPYLTSLTYNALSVQAQWLCHILSDCIVAPLLDNVSFRTPDAAHFYRTVEDECRQPPPPTTTNSPKLHTCGCWTLDPTNLIPNSDIRNTCFKRLVRTLDHLFVSRDAYHPIRNHNHSDGNNNNDDDDRGGGYRFHIHGVTDNNEPVDYPSLIPFLRPPPSHNSHDPRYTRRNVQGILLSGYAYACPNRSRRPVKASASEHRKYNSPNPLSELISGFGAFANDLVNVRHLELATGGVELLIMEEGQEGQETDDISSSWKRSGLWSNTQEGGMLHLDMALQQRCTINPVRKSLGAVRHVTLWGPLSSSLSRQGNAYWLGSDIERVSPTMTV